MANSSFESGWNTDPLIQVLEIRDKDAVEAEPIAWVMIERQETSQRDAQNVIQQATIRIHYHSILQKNNFQSNVKGYFDGSYSKNNNAVSLTSPTMARGAVCIDLDGLRGQRIGTYLMNQIVTWALQWPDASVNAIGLSSSQGDDENKTRRNWFYEQFGIKFNYSDSHHRGGTSHPMQVRALTPVDAWAKNIKVMTIFEYLENVLTSNKNAKSELMLKERAIDGYSKREKEAQANPIRWCLKQIWLKNIVFGFWVGILVLFSTMIWLAATK